MEKDKSIDEIIARRMLNVLFACIGVMILIGLCCFITSSCKSNNNNEIIHAKHQSYAIFEVDTISIHNHKHEIVIYKVESGNKGGIMHSPECWCLKDTIK